MSLISPAIWTLYVGWPARGWGIFEGLPLSPFATAAIAILCLASAVSSNRAFLRGRWPALLLVMKLAGSAALIDRGLVADYFPNDTFAPPIAHSVDFPRASYTRIDPVLDFGSSAKRDLPLYFLNDEAGFSASSSVAESRSARAWSASWTGYLMVARDETVTAFLRGHRVAADVFIDGTRVVALGLDADDNRAPTMLQSGWHQLQVTLRAPPGAGRDFYSGFIDASGVDRAFGGPDAYARRLLPWRVTLDGAVRNVSWLIDVILIGVLGVRLGSNLWSALTASWASLIGLGMGLAMFAYAIGSTWTYAHRLVLFEGAALTAESNARDLLLNGWRWAGVPASVFALLHMVFGEGPFGIVLARQLAIRVPVVLVAAIVATVVARRDIASRDGSARRLNHADLGFGLIGVGLVLMFITLPHLIGGDGRERLNAVTDLLEHGRVSSMPYSLVGPFFSAPLYYLGKVVGDAEWLTARYNTVLITVGVFGIVALLRRHVDRQTLGTFLLLLVVASMFPNHLRNYYSEVFTVVCVALGTAAIVTGRSGLGWSFMVVGVVNTPAMMLGLLFVAIRKSWNDQRLRHLLPVIAAGLLITIEAWVRRGGPFVTGYVGNAGIPTVMPYSGRPGFSYPIFFGVLSILFSFGKGVVFYAPGLLLPIRRSDVESSNTLRECHAMWLWFLVGLVLVYAKWWAWYGGWFWGPRFFLVASPPASLAIAVRLQNVKRLSLGALTALAIVLVWSIWIGIDGAVFDQAGLGRCMQDGYALEFLCWYTPEFSALWHPFFASIAMSTSEALFTAYCLLVLAWLGGPVFNQISSDLASYPFRGALERVGSMRL